MNKRLIYTMSALLPFAIMFIVFIFLGVYPFGDKTLMAIDFASQYIDLFAYLKRAVLTFDVNSFFYSFSKSLGGDMVGVWGYYLLSPFNIFYIILPVEELRIAATLTILFRYSAMGLTFCHFLVKRYDGLSKRPLLIPTFSVLYALTGFNVAYQMNPLWYDAMVMLPLVMLGVETVLDGGKGYKYSLVLGASIIFQYYMSYMMCLFIILYSLVYMAGHYKGSNLKEKMTSFVKPIGRLAIYSILGVGVSAIVLYPVVQNLLISKGTYIENVPFVWGFEFNPLDILSKTMIGAFDYDQMPNGLPNIYVGAVAMVGFCLYFATKKIKRVERIVAFIVMLIFVLSMAHDFSNKIWHLGQTPAWFYHRFTYLTSFFMVLLGYRAIRQMDRLEKRHLTLAVGIILIVNGLVYQQHMSFMSVPQQIVSTVLWLVVLGLFYMNKTMYTWLLIMGLTVVETGINAYIDQSRIGYANAHSFLNAYQVLDEVIAPIRPKQSEFYRIAKMFNRTKNDPFMHNYPGLTHFSSNMEASTLDLFDLMGDAGSNAATNYGSGTPLTDALYGVRYIVQMKNLTDVQKQDSTIYSFTRESTRKDLYTYYQAISETERFRVYQNNHVLPIGFGVSQAFVDLTLEANQPAKNQNAILQTMSGNTEVAYFSQFAFNHIQLDNFETDNPNDLSSVKLTRIDKDKRATIKYIFTPQTDESYYISLPASVNKSKSDIKMTLNGQVYEYYRTFDHRQLWSIAHGSKGKEVTFEISTDTLNDLDIFNVRLWKLDGELTRQALSQVGKQGMTVTRWTSNSMEGTVNITQDTPYLMTSIPYSKGWHVKVDNQTVYPVQVWGSLMAVPITPGQHTIKMVYTPLGFIAGALMTAISGMILFGIYWVEKNKGIRLSRRRKNETI